MAMQYVSSNTTHIQYTSAAVTAAVSVFSVVGSIGNGLVLYVFGFRFPKSPFNVLVTTLALFDLLVCILFMPIDVVFMACDGLIKFRLQLCQLGYVVMDVCIVATSVLLCDIAYTRFRMISCPLKKQVTLRHANVTIVIGTTLGVFMGMLSFFSAVVVDIPMDNGFVLVDCGSGYNNYGKIYIAYYVLMISLITSTVALISLFYIQIARSLIQRRTVTGRRRNSAKTTTGIMTLSLSEHPSTYLIQEAKRRKESLRRSRTINTVMMMFTVTFCFALSYSPYLVILSICFVFQTITCKNMAYYPFIFRSVYISNVANFVIYGCFSAEFRRELILLLR